MAQNSKVERKFVERTEDALNLPENVGGYLKQHWLRVGETLAELTGYISGYISFHEAPFITTTQNHRSRGASLPASGSLVPDQKCWRQCGVAD